MNERLPIGPVYLPALVLISALALGYVVASGWQYDDQPWTIFLALPAVLLMLLAFMLLLFGHPLAVLFILLAVLLALPYYTAIYLRVLLNVAGGEKGYGFSAAALSLIAAVISFTVFRALQSSKNH